ncbi:putative zinc-binding metallopeptidase [Polaribacter sp. Z014]|uniref:zinc-binding metallopeptidase n=1 Tax=Polaribacter sp. Z014 TaxID=2927126 RepID=UPI00202105C3|nr:putative zinc-binding metallopeptidase [Polaribacter sp. Z014]MCL7761819.1 putative zinc-binding metallopeptidase [Polaribacter sp. Z014]
MRKIIYIFIAAMCSTAIFTSCEETDLPSPDKSVIKVENGIENQFDVFLRKEFVSQYNVELLYKLPDIESDLNYYVVPSDYEKSIKMANLINYYFFEPFKEVGSLEFIKKTTPKMFVLVGSGAYNNNGTVLLGTAEGGLKVVLYDINNIDVTDIERLNDRYFRTVYHEFGHILHQNKPYTRDFEKITGTTYVQDEWNTIWDAGESLEAGYISDYASNQPNDDFVELIAHYLTKSSTEWSDIITAAGDEGGPIITQKLTIVKNYLKESWNIDMDDLRDNILVRQQNLNNLDLDNIN